MNFGYDSTGGIKVMPESEKTAAAPDWLNGQKASEPLPLLLEKPKRKRRTKQEIADAKAITDVQVSVLPPIPVIPYYESAPPAPLTLSDAKALRMFSVRLELSLLSCIVGAFWAKTARTVWLYPFPFVSVKITY